MNDNLLHYREICEKENNAAKRSYSLICTIVPFVMLIILFVAGMFTLGSFNHPALFLITIILNIICFSASNFAFLLREYIANLVLKEATEFYSKSVPDTLKIAGKGWMNYLYTALEITSGVSLFAGLILTGVFYLFV